MFDFFIPAEIYERVIRNDRIKNKFWGFFWREMIAYLAVILVIIGIVLLTVKDIMNTPPLNAALAVLVMFILCVVKPIIDFKLLQGKTDKSKKT